MQLPARLVKCAAAALVVTAASVCQASHPCGIYARIDKVEVGPDADAPTWVKVHGDFILIKTSGRLQNVERGYMHFSIIPKKEAHCRIEWSDLEEVARTTHYVAFGSVHSERFDRPATGVKPPEGAWRPEVYAEDAKESKPFPYPLNWGLSRLRTRPDDSLYGTGDGDDAVGTNPVLLLQRYLKDHPLKETAGAGS